jgi:hypothetical protein
MKDKKHHEESFFKKKSTIAVFALVAFVAGVIFLDKRATGNIILNKYQPFNAVSIIGMLLILCSVILIGYYAHKNK